MGLGTSEQLLIKAVAENDIREAKKYALAALKNDTTQKNRYFVNKYTSILTMPKKKLCRKILLPHVFLLFVSNSSA